AARPVDGRAAPMISGKVKLQVTAFVVLAALGVAFVGIRYVGLGDALLGRTYQVHADFAESGGIFTNAAVTYRGVQVGRVGELTLRPDGVRVSLRLDDGVQVPANTRAVVTNRSAVGEQYVDLRPPTGEGPYLRPDDVIPLRNTSGPLAVEVVLLHLDELVRSVGQEDLRIVIDELGKAFEGTGPVLRDMITQGDALLATATENLPQTIALIRDGQTVLDTQVASSTAIRSWANSLAQLSATLRASDADLRRLLANGPVASAELVALLRDLRPHVGLLLGNLITAGQIQARRVNGLEQILVTYPSVVAGNFTVTPGDGTAHFGLVLNFDDPPPCVYERRNGTYACDRAERSHGSAVRGWQNAPRPGRDAGPEPLGPPAQDPGVLPGTVPNTPAMTRQELISVAGYDPVTGMAVGPDGQPLQFGMTGGQQRILGEQSWKALLFGPLTG
ncbi:MAG TPA: MlaD family protein, partial [Cryptosporangiaceae bacterium]|nr:MlaD family protein [Cryptosporangiaceae bacterium]